MERKKEKIKKNISQFGEGRAALETGWKDQAFRTKWCLRHRRSFLGGLWPTSIHFKIFLSGLACTTTLHVATLYWPCVT